MKTLPRLLAAAALLLTAPALAQTAPAAPTAASAAPVDADPALWVMRDADTTIYLFGTVHVLRPGMVWFDEAVRAAFDASDELKLEAILPDDTSTMVPLVMRYAIDPQGRTMTSRLNPEQLTKYTTGMATVGIPTVAMDQFEPWLINLTLLQVMVQRAGYEANAGAEMVLRTAATATNKRLSAFETVEEQISFLDSTPVSEQMTGIFTVLDDLGSVTTGLDQLVESWAAGNPDVTGDLINEALVSAPESARILLTDRNRRWAEVLQARMAQPGTVFVAVGAGHLTGDNSVQQFLAAHGLVVTRVNY